jgi:hypothetical protein
MLILPFQHKDFVNRLLKEGMIFLWMDRRPEKSPAMREEYPVC